MSRNRLWTSEQESTFIEQVQQYRQLWDPSLNEYRESLLKGDLWSLIVNYMKETYEDMYWLNALGEFMLIIIPSCICLLLNL